LEVAAIIARLDVLLAEERAAIARLDGSGVERLNEEKQTLAFALEERTPDERRSHAPRLRRLVRGLQQNGLLLAQARGILADVLATQGVRPHAERGGFPLVPMPRIRHLSIRG